MYAVQNLPFPPCVAVRLIGPLDTDFVTAFREIERDLGRSERATVLVDVRDLTVHSQRDMAAIVEIIRRARAENRDVRLDARSAAWHHAAKQHLSHVPPVDAELRSGVRRTVILAHSRRKMRSTFGQ